MEEKLNKSFDWEETFKAALSKGDENTLEKVLRIFPGVWAGKGCVHVSKGFSFSYKTSVKVPS